MLKRIASTESSDEAQKSTGSQTLVRGLDVLEAVAAGAATLSEIASRLDLTKSTAHRLASALVERGYLTATPRAGYGLGPKLLQLGHAALEQLDLVQAARPHLEALAEATEDTVHLGVIDGNQALYVDKVAGQRRINISSRVGERQPLSSTGLGKALMLDAGSRYWAERLQAEQPQADAAAFLARMTRYAEAGRAFDLEENEDRIRCVAAPVRDASGRVVAAISVSSAAQYMDDARMEALSATVRGAADAIGRELGWSPA
ncbi:IclR family transcriptional regulator [Sphingomonas tabacisoli]|uniref:IclR family transcriptional regulator n=1 Tax=Sphingomonas tabacisoli TaxID=2249466 RepID=A0ABW4I8R0_9SPHN